MDHRVALLGKTVGLASIGAALADVPELELLPVEIICEDATAWVDAFAPDVVVFDLAAGLPDHILRYLAARPGLALIGFDLGTRKMLLLSGERATLATTDDLVRAVKKLTAAANLEEPA
jgi:hypothetical protein